MSYAQLRARGQAALFAGIWLFAFIPFFQFGALQSTGYGAAAQAAIATKNYAPVLVWASGHPALIILFPLLEAIPLIVTLALPLTLQRVVYGNEAQGRIGRWAGMAGLLVVAVVTLVDMLILLAAANQYTGASAANRAAIGANFRFTAIAESMVVDILGFALLAIWLIAVSAPLARLAGYERVCGIAGLLVAALELATAGLVLFNPQQSQGALVGTSLALLGVWLALVGYLLIARAPALSAPSDDV